MKKKYLKQGLGLAATSIGLGVGTSVVSEVGGDPAGINNMSRALPTIGSVVGTGMVMEALGNLNKSAKKKKMRCF